MTSTCQLAPVRYANKGPARACIVEKVQHEMVGCGGLPQFCHLISSARLPALQLLRGGGIMS